MYHIRTIKRFTIGALYDKMVGERIKDCHLVKRDVEAYRVGECPGEIRANPFTFYFFCTSIVVIAEGACVNAMVRVMTLLSVHRMYLKQHHMF